jgi:hypothetical protein
VSENLIWNVAPHLAPPVTRESIHSASDTGDGADLTAYSSKGTWMYSTFVDDDAE